MQFGSVPLDQALGAVLAHSVPLPGGRLRKGVVLGQAELDRLRLTGITLVTVARLEAGDIAEDHAALLLAQAMVPDGAALGLRLTEAFTGRVNLHAIEAGILELDVEAVHRMNAIDPAITCATLAPFARVEAGMLVGTVKIIPYAVAGGALAQACEEARMAMRVRPVVVRSAGLILTEVAGQDRKLAMKGAKVIQARLAALGITLAGVEIVAHDEAAIAQAMGRMGQELLLILTGSATSDANDTAPAGVRLAGGRVDRFGMPVDPGNLLFLGELEGRPVIGLPGCARSPALNGADWVLERVACGIEVTGQDIARMGVGGLLMEIPIRPQPRERK